MSSLRGLSLLALIILTGCNIHHYDYRTTPTFTGKMGAATVVVVGLDDRNDLKAGEIDANYVGLVRDMMAAIPYRVHTLSRKAVADDLALSVADGLRKAGARAESVGNPQPGSMEAAMAAGRATGKSRILLVRVYRLESDSMIRTELFYDIAFEVYDPSGRLLGSSRVHDQKMFPGSIAPYYTASKTLPPTIRMALERGIAPLLKFL